MNLKSVGFQLIVVILFTMDKSLGAPKDDDFPFMAALGWKDDSGALKFYGGGMLISSKMVLTAAHAAYNKPPDIVFLGGKNISEVESSNLKKYSVVNVEIFPQYSPRLAYHDIAILELNDTATDPPICLWNHENLTSDVATAIGYGETEFDDQQLVKVNLTVFPSEVCEPFYEYQRRLKSGISDAHICAGDKDDKDDTCKGDSGGPLIARHNDQTFAIGIASVGIGCSRFQPALYTKIHPYMEWITSVLKDKKQSLKLCDA